MSYIPEQPTNSSNQATNVNPFAPASHRHRRRREHGGPDDADDDCGIAISAAVLPDGLPVTAFRLRLASCPMSRSSAATSTTTAPISCASMPRTAWMAPPDVAAVTAAGGDSIACGVGFRRRRGAGGTGPRRAGQSESQLYATYTADATAFHDITRHQQCMHCRCSDLHRLHATSGGSSGLSAGPGYDAASGLGSVDVAKLISSWRSTTGAATPTVTLSLTEGTKTVTSFSA